MSNELEKLWEKDQSKLLQEGGGDLKELNDLCKKQMRLEDTIERKQEEIDNLKAELKKVSFDDIPNLLAEKGLEKLKLRDGNEIVVRKVINAYLPKEDADPEGRAKSLEWLRNNDLGDIIKNNVTVSFGRGEDNKALDYASLAQKNGYLPTQKVDVNNRQLVAALKERLENGLDVPSELFKLFVGNQTKIKRSS